MDKVTFAKNYQGDKSYPFPSEDITQDQRESRDYYLACCNAIASRYFNNKCAVPYDGWGSDRRPFKELRAYRYGNQNINKYKGWMVGSPDKNGVPPKTTINISWGPVQILPQKMDVVNGFMQKIKYIPNAIAIDYEALISKQTAISMAKIVSDDRIDRMRNMVNEAAGASIINPQAQSDNPSEMQFDNPQQVDIAAQMGLFFLQEEIAIINLLDKTAYESTSEIICDQVKDDLLTLGFAGKRVYVNPNTKIVMEDYVDVDMAIFPHSKYKDYRDITYAGEFKKYTIARLRKETDIPEQELIRIAKSYASGGNMVMESPNFYGNIYQNQGSNMTFGMNMMDQIEVDVLDCRWLGKKNVNMTTVYRKEGWQYNNLVKDGYELNNYDKNKGKQLNNYTHTTCYKAKMVLGSGFVFDFGEDNDIEYTKSGSGYMEPVFPYKFVRTGTSSLVDRTIEFVDDACMANYKLRIARMKMPAPPNIQVDRSALEGMKIDGITYKPQQLLKLLQDEGILIVDTKNQWGNNTGAGRPIMPIGSDLMQVIVGWWEDMARSISMIEKVTSINDLFAAQTPDRTTAVGIANLAVQGAQNAFTPIIKADKYLYEATIRAQVKKWQIVSTYMTDEERNRLAIGRSLKMVKIGSNLADFDFDIKIEAGYTDDEKAQLLADLNNMKAASRAGGQQSMTEADYLIIENMIRTDKIKQAQLYTAFAVERRRKEAQQEQMQMVQANAQTQQQSAAQKAQSDQQQIAMQGQVDAQNNAQKQGQQIQGQIQLEVVKAQLERQNMLLENQLGLNKKSA